MMHWQFLWTDYLIWILAFGLVGALFFIQKTPHLRAPWESVFKTPVGMVTAVVLLFYGAISLLDSLHFTILVNQHPHFQSVLDTLIAPLGQQVETTYTAPFSTLGVSKAILLFAVLWAIVKCLLLMALLLVCCLLWVSVKKKQTFRWCWLAFFCDKTVLRWRAAAVTFFIGALLLATLLGLSQYVHVLGTDKIGRDILYIAIQSIRTGVLIGTLTTLFMLPFALALGMMAGYYRGWIDDVIQYIYTTLSSIPGVLLISACILVLQVVIANHANWFGTLAQRADARLLALCVVLGLTSWTSLCRLLRAETMKLREQEFVLAARTMGVRPARILWQHILPNVMHIVLITLVLDFSGLVLAEAVLSYVGVGVDPTTMSWGNMINSSRLELARSPIVWWPLLSALVFMFGLVLSANLFADRVRDAFEPS